MEVEAGPAQVGVLGAGWEVVEAGDGVVRATAEAVTKRVEAVKVRVEAVKGAVAQVMGALSAAKVSAVARRVKAEVTATMVAEMETAARVETTTAVVATVAVEKVRVARARVVIQEVKVKPAKGLKVKPARGLEALTVVAGGWLEEGWVATTAAWIVMVIREAEDASTMAASMVAVELAAAAQVRSAEAWQARGVARAASLEPTGARSKSRRRRQSRRPECQAACYRP